ncbi:TIGR00300 family protein, partial [Halobium palmae]
AGPAVIHSGAGDALARLVREGYVDMLSAGNGFATHDIERNLYGTSLGMDVETMEHPRKGHKHHIYTISEVIRAGGIREAVDEGLVTEGVMYELVRADADYVLAGSIRDDGPLPDTVTDAVAAQNAIREQAHEADLVLMLSTLLHSVAVGNCLPSTTRVVCVDINPATVTQLLDRGSSQAIGMVTDVGTFVPNLAEEVLGPADCAEGGKDRDGETGENER